MGLATQVLKRRSTRLDSLIRARITRDGVLALPALSFALALTARLAAHGDPNAARLYERLGQHHAQLARHAPLFTSIDIVRAEAALIGEIR